MFLEIDTLEEDVHMLWNKGCSRKSPTRFELLNYRILGRLKYKDFEVATRGSFNLGTASWCPAETVGTWIVYTRFVDAKNWK